MTQIINVPRGGISLEDALDRLIGAGKGGDHARMPGLSYGEPGTRTGSPESTLQERRGETQVGRESGRETVYRFCKRKAHGRIPCADCADIDECIQLPLGEGVL
jgi:hypothetical protein